MTMVHTDFRPEIDGFAFSNSWTLDDAERAQVHALVVQELPTAVGILTPILLAASPIILATLGPALLLAGPFLPFALGLALTRGVDEISDLISDHSQGWCGGMAYASADYFAMNWALPRGDSGAQPQPIENGGTVASQQLREYIWSRLIDAQLANLKTFIAWTFMQQVMGDFGRDWLRDQTRSEIATVKARINAGTPCVICLLAASGSDITQNHVVVATGFEDLGPDHCRIQLYDNVSPDVTRTLEIDTSVSPVVVSESDPVKSWAGMFCADYTPMRPPPAVVAKTSISLAPSNFAGVGLPVRIAFVAANQGAGTTLDLHLCVGAPASHWASIEESGVKHAAPEASDILMNQPVQFIFNDSGIVQMVPKVKLWPANKKNPDGTTALPSLKTLPNPDGSPVPTLHYQVNPKIKIVGRVRGADACTPVYVAGATVILSPQTAPVAGIGIVGYQWVVSGGMTMTSQASTLVLPALPSANSHLRIDLTISLADGTTASGWLDIVVMDVAMANRMTMICHLLHIVEHRLIPQFGWNPAVDPLVNPAPDWFNQRALRRAANPEAVVKGAAALVAELEEALHRGGGGLG